MSVVDRNMRLLDGRRVQLLDLIDAGLLAAGDVLEFNRPRAGQTHTAVVTEEGRLRLEDGREFAAPSRAAVEAGEVRSIDGWLVWVHQRTGQPLAQLRHEVLAQAVQMTRPGADEDPEQSRAELRHETLEAAYALADQGSPRALSVRELLSLWASKARGPRVVDRMLADLDNHSLTTDPDFRKVGLDSTVHLVKHPAAEVDEPATPETEAPAGSEMSDVGLTLGNIPSALTGLVSVKATDTLATAMTLMRLQDFSQLPVLPSPRKLLGAITWRSIAKALAGGSATTVAEAIEPARLFNFDADLIDALPVICEHDFVFVTNDVAEVSGVVTTSDVVQLYGETATPFFIIGEIDHLLRRAIADEWTIQQVAEICGKADGHGITSHDDLSMGDYQRVLESPDRFTALGWPLDRVTFIKALDDVRQIRNGVAHFDPDPLEPAAVELLRHFLHLLREVTSDD